MPPRHDEAVIPSPLGPLHFTTRDGRLIRVDFDDLQRPLTPPSTPFGREVQRQLDAYFADPAAPFSLPTESGGTDHQRRVWQALLRIPRGATRSYGELAGDLGSAARAVGGACRANPLLIVVPCHRVVAADGGLGGFSGAVDGAPLARKRWLLDHEASA